MDSAIALVLAIAVAFTALLVLVIVILYGIVVIKSLKQTTARLEQQRAELGNQPGIGEMNMEMIRKINAKKKDI